MWNEPMPKWRTARKQHQCQGESCSKGIELGERYLDRVLRTPAHSHLRYCKTCAVPVIASADSYHFFNGRSDFPDRYVQHLSSSEWKSLRCKVIEQRGNKCERCGQRSESLSLHHLHYRSLGREQLEDVALLCHECHLGADLERASKGRPVNDDPQEVLIVTEHGDHWGKLDPDAIYIPLKDGRYLPLNFKGKVQFRQP
jgi:hypothetical protein